MITRSKTYVNGPTPNCHFDALNVDGIRLAKLGGGRNIKR